MPVPTVSELPELVIFGNPLPKSRFSAFSATFFYANRITDNIWPRVHGPLCGSQMVKLKKKTYFIKIICACWDFAEKCKCSCILRKTSFWECVSFPHDMFGVTVSELVLPICIGNAMIGLKK